MTSGSQKESLHKDNILRVTIHYCDNLKSNTLLLQPVACMHVIDSKTGTYVKKSDKNRAVISFYENQRNDVDYIMPVMTQPCSLPGEKLNSYNWEEVFIVNEKYNLFVDKESSILLFFEIVDFIPVSHTMLQYERLNQSGMHKIAWAFLKILGCNSIINTGSKLRLQLYKPYKSVKKKNVSYVEVYKWWLKKPRIPLEASSLFISIEPHPIFTAEPALRSMLPTQQEKGSTTFEKLNVYDKDSLNYSEISKSIHEDIQETEITWSRKPGDPCKIPKKKELFLDVVNSCSIIKFSSNGRFLAAGCGSHEFYYLMFYQIPSGKLLQKILAHSELIYDLDWSHNDKHILSASGDYSVKMWNSKCWTLVTIFAHPSFVYCAKFHPTSDCIFVSSCYDHVIRVWTLEKSQLLKELEAHNSSVCALCWNPSGTTLYSADGIGHIKVWEKSKQARNEFYHLQTEINPEEIKGLSINKMVLDMQEETLCLFCSDSVARILSLRSESILSSYESEEVAPKLSRGTCSPCGNLLFLCAENGSVSVWNKKTSSKNCAELLYNLNYGAPSCIDYHPLENMLALSFWDEGVPIHVFTYDITGREDKKDNIKTYLNVPDSNKNSEQKPKITSSANKNNKFKKRDIMKQNELEKKLTKEAPLDVPASISNKKHAAAKYHVPKSEETSSSGSADLFSTSSSRNCSESLTAVITKSGQFDVIAIPDDSAGSDSNTFRSIGTLGVNDSTIFNRSSKRSERRRKLREMNKALL